MNMKIKFLLQIAVIMAICTASVIGGIIWDGWAGGIFAVVCWVITYLILRISTMILGGMDVLFSSPKQGRIKAVTKGNRTVGFIAHLKGLTGELPAENPGDDNYVGPVHIDEVSGMILPGEEKIWDIWWIMFGVRFIGFNTIKRFDTERRTVGADGKPVIEKVTASSLHFANTYPFWFDDLETKNGNKGDLGFTISLQTTNASESLKYADFVQVIVPSVQAGSKDFVTENTVKSLLETKNETINSVKSFISFMRLLNQDRVGNISLHRKVGQLVTAANLTHIVFEDAISKALEAAEEAKRQGAAAVKKAKLEADAQVQKARGDKATKQVDVDILKEKKDIFAQPGGKEAAVVETSRQLSEAIGKHPGTLVLGQQVMPTLPIN
jgi:hypothetical protein